MTDRSRATARAVTPFPGISKRTVVLVLILSSILCRLAEAARVQAENVPAEPGKRNELLQAGRFVQIPGPNPILMPGGKGAWDEGVIEAADALKDLGTYYLYYHATGRGKGYRIGVATASHPLGPFRKHGNKPILDLGPPGGWDGHHVACAMILKEGIDKYFMWYSGLGSPEQHPKWSIGLATADNPLGPWKKYQGNPILEDFGYVGGVVKVKGKYYLYAAHPINSTGEDYSPMSLAVADKPEGPWKVWGKNPVLRQGEWGEWDDGGFSEAEVLYSGGVFHMFYGGAKLFPVRMCTRESIGYAYSFDGYNFVKYGRNPVAARQANPNAAAFSEVHAIFESPFIYLYHTLRYKQPRTAAEKEKFPALEHLGVQVLVTQKPFRLDMPVLSREALGPKTMTSLADSPPVCLSSVRQLALTAECEYSQKATKPLRIHVRSSCDGTRYDTTDLYRLDNDFKPGGLCRKTFQLDAKVRFIKVAVENLDQSESVSKVKISATLGS